MRFILVMFLCLLPTMSLAAALIDIEAALMDKDYHAASKLANEVIAGDAATQDKISAAYFLGLAQMRLGQFADARKYFQIVLASGCAQELYEKAALGHMEGLTLAGFYKDALKEGLKFLHRNPHTSSKSLVYLKIARANLKLRQWVEARRYLNKVITEFPQSLEAPIAQGLLEEKEFFAVQVGSFKDRDKAFKLVDELKAKDQYAYIVEMTSPHGDKFYRVRVGKSASLDQAQNVQTNLSSQGYPTLIYPWFFLSSVQLVLENRTLVYL